MVFENVAKIQDSINELIENFETVQQEAIKRAEGSFVFAQQEQMLDGETAEAKQIGEYRSPIYADYKYAKNQRAGLGVVDLKDTGDFYEAMRLEVEKDIEMYSNDPKAPDLVKKYGENIFGLQEKNLPIEAVEIEFEKILKERYKLI
jgi:hypothetical protein